MSEEVIQLIVVPEDGLCEGCREPLGEDVFEDETGLVLCKGCYDLCLEDAEDEEDAHKADGREGE